MAAVGCTTSPATSSHPSAASDAARDGSRTSAVTASPRARSARATAPITKPVAPVTKTLIGGILSRLDAFHDCREAKGERMNIAIIGAGNVGGALAKSSVRAGHTVTLSAKDPAHAEAKAKETGARAVSKIADAVKAADVVILAVPFTAVDPTIAAAGHALPGKGINTTPNATKTGAMPESTTVTTA